MAELTPTKKNITETTMPNTADNGEQIIDEQIASQDQNQQVPEQTEQNTDPGDPQYNLWKTLSEKKAYTKSYEEFKNKFNSPENVDVLYSKIFENKDYGKSKDDFYNEFFPSLKKNETLSQGQQEPAQIGTSETSQSESSSTSPIQDQIQTQEQPKDQKASQPETSQVEVDDVAPKPIISSSEGLNVGAPKQSKNIINEPAKDVEPQLNLVDWLKSKNMPYDKETRTKLAEKYGIQGYDFSDTKNNDLLDYVKTDYDLAGNLKELNYANDDQGIQKYAQDNGLQYDGSLQSKKAIIDNATPKVKSKKDVQDLVSYAVTFGNVDVKNLSPEEAQSKLSENLTKEAQGFGIKNFNLQDPLSVSELAKNIRVKKANLEAIYKNIQYVKPIGAPQGIVEVLQTLNMPSDMQSRAKLALQKGVVANESEYIGSGAQNDKLVELLKTDYQKAKFVKNVNDVAKEFGFKKFDINNQQDLKNLSTKLSSTAADRQSQYLQYKRDKKDYEKNGAPLGMDYETYKRYKLNYNKFGRESNTDAGYEFVASQGGMVKRKLSDAEKQKYDDLPVMLYPPSRELERQKNNAKLLNISLSQYQGLQMMIMHGDYSFFEKIPEFAQLAKTNPKEFRNKAKEFLMYPDEYQRQKKQLFEDEQRAQRLRDLDAYGKQVVEEDKRSKQKEDQASGFGGLKYIFSGDLGQLPDRLNNLAGYLWNNAWAGATQTAGGGIGFLEKGLSPVTNLFVKGQFVPSSSTATADEIQNVWAPALTVGLHGKDEIFAKDLITSATGSLANMLPSALISPGGVPVGFAMQGYGNAMKEIESSPDGRNLPQIGKELYGVSNGIMQALIAKVGIDRIFGATASRKLAINTTINTIKEAEANNIILTPYTFEKLAMSKLNALKSKAFEIASHGVTGGAFGLAMTLNDKALKAIMNFSTGKNIFEKADFSIPKDFASLYDANAWGKTIAEMIESTRQGALMGMIGSGAPMMFNKKESALKTEIMKADTPEALNKIKEDLNSEAEARKFSTQEIESLNKIIDEYATYNDKIPDNIINPNLRLEVAENLKRRDGLVEDLNQLIESKKTQDPAFHEGIDIQINGINRLIEEINKNISDINTGKKVEPVVVTKDAIDLVQSESVPTEMTAEIQKVAEDNGINVNENTTPQDVVDGLKNKIGAEEPIVRENVDAIINNYESTVADAEKRLQENPKDSKASQDLANAQIELENIKKDPVKYFEQQKEKAIDELQARVESGEDPATLKIDAVAKNFDELIEDAKQYARENPIGEESLNKSAEKQKAYDQENVPGVPGEVGVGEEPIAAKPVKGAGAEETTAGGVLQAPGAKGEVKATGEEITTKITEGEPTGTKAGATVEATTGASKEQKAEAGVSRGVEPAGERATEATATILEPKEGDLIELAPQVEGGVPRRMIFKDGEWRQQVGDKITNVGESVKNKAQAEFQKQKGAEVPVTEAKPEVTKTGVEAKLTELDKVRERINKINAAGEKGELLEDSYPGELKELKAKEKAIVDIEKRRQEELNKLAATRDANLVNIEKTGDSSRSELRPNERINKQIQENARKTEHDSYEYGVKRANSKYDAELKALEGTKAEAPKTETKPTERVSAQDIKPNTTYEGEYKGKPAKITVGDISKDGMANVEISSEGKTIAGGKTVTEVADLVNAKAKAETKIPEQKGKAPKGKAAKFVEEHIEKPKEEGKVQFSKENEPAGAVPRQEHTVETIDKADTTGFSKVQKKNLSDARRILKTISNLILVK